MMQTFQKRSRVKQQIIAFCTRHGKSFDGKSYCTKKHVDRLCEINFDSAVLKETLQEYMILYFQLREKVDMYDCRIEELSRTEAYLEPVQKLGCLRGIAAHTALLLCVEVGDFKRFATAQQFAPYLGLTPGNAPAETSSIIPALQKPEIPAFGSCLLRRRRYSVDVLPKAANPRPLRNGRQNVIPSS